ncbi:RagB/SusD family nutrient uptake outer membrane protein [Negadavirga shengliensis]|uniref:RagB/SusD family nutrient uptake outer membrane protein n=1 Tax=Negadavirga shengliensis TaxID=1389218 RepID=A0ABV9T9D6_9BACT
MKTQPTKKSLLGFLLVATVLATACEEFLDPRPDQSLLVPETLDDLQALLDNTQVFNYQPGLTSLATDELWVPESVLSGLINPVEAATYTWAADPYQGGFTGSWSLPYEQIFYANVVLEALENIADNNGERFRRIKGTAHFFRAYAYYQLLQEFAPPFPIDGNFENLLGVVIKDVADINEPLKRAGLKDGYDYLAADLEKALALLPEQVTPQARPARTAALGLKARFGLTTFQYGQALQAAEEALSIYGDGIDFNDLDPALPNPFVRFNAETINYTLVQSYSFMGTNLALVDTLLYRSYAGNDLRKEVLFSENAAGYHHFTGRLSGTPQFFGGFTVGELKLVAAESAARLGDPQKALEHLNSLLSRRYEKESWVPVEEKEPSKLLEIILAERRKELIGRGLRWIDLRRLNQEQEHAITLRRVIGGTEHLLPPNSLKYTFPLPDEEIQLTGLTQNPR